MPYWDCRLARCLLLWIVLLSLVDKSYGRDEESIRALASTRTRRPTPVRATRAPRPTRAPRTKPPTFNDPLPTKIPTLAPTHAKLTARPTAYVPPPKPGEESVPGEVEALLPEAINSKPFIYAGIGLGLFLIVLASVFLVVRSLRRSAASAILNAGSGGPSSRFGTPPPYGNSFSSPVLTPSLYACSPSPYQDPKSHFSSSTLSSNAASRVADASAGLRASRQGPQAPENQQQQPKQASSSQIRPAPFTRPAPSPPPPSSINQHVSSLPPLPPSPTQPPAKPRPVARPSNLPPPPIHSPPPVARAPSSQPPPHRPPRRGHDPPSDRRGRQPEAPPRGRELEQRQAPPQRGRRAFVEGVRIREGEGDDGDSGF